MAVKTAPVTDIQARRRELAGFIAARPKALAESDQIAAARVELAHKFAQARQDYLRADYLLAAKQDEADRQADRGGPVTVGEMIRSATPELQAELREAQAARDQCRALVRQVRHKIAQAEAAAAAIAAKDIQEPADRAAAKRLKGEIKELKAQVAEAVRLADDADRLVREAEVECLKP